MRLAHLVTGEKYSDKQMERIFYTSKGVIDGEQIIHPYKTSASNLLEIIIAIPNHSYIALCRDPKSDLLHVRKSRAPNKKKHKITKDGAQNLTLLTKLQGKRKLTVKHVMHSQYN
jgi:hypothetical protein